MFFGCFFPFDLLCDPPDRLFNGSKQHGFSPVMNAMIPGLLKEFEQE